MPRPEHLRVRQAGGIEHQPHCPVGARLRPLNPNCQGKPPWALWTPRSGPLRVRQARGRECLSQGPAGAQSEIAEHSHEWESSPDPVPGAFPLGGPEGKAQDRGSQLGAVGTPEPKLTGEASLGPVDSLAWPPQGTAGWRKGAPAPGFSGVPVGHLNLNWKGTPSRPGRLPGPGPSEYGKMEEGNTHPRAWHGPGAQSEVAEHSHTWESCPDLSPLPCHLVGRRV
ncbi:hypothetical protein NDU88_002969 [Pleurodeles waltl]|uniref:Uncharacterized protein n=1 Tax=Pleurodeles waltl TaxID=8319 RepID=A0AAV7PDB2_PLEWA|nr:hypothetical protein NDU88_002969 [Pleurodeles waltl]